MVCFRFVTKTLMMIIISMMVIIISMMVMPQRDYDDGNVQVFLVKAGEPNFVFRTLPGAPITRF